LIGSSSEQVRGKAFSVRDIDAVNSEIKDKKLKGRMPLLRRCGGNPCTCPNRMRSAYALMDHQKRLFAGD
jgi:hypothetical protein